MTKVQYLFDVPPNNVYQSHGIPNLHNYVLKQYLTNYFLLLIR